MTVKVTSAGAYVMCDGCGKKSPAIEGRGRIEETLIVMACERADRAGWDVPQSGEAHDFCPICAAEPCRECGAIVRARAGHAGGTHHIALVLCTERAQLGFAPVHPSLRSVVEDVDDVTGFYRALDAHRRTTTQPFRFARVELLEEIAPSTPAADVIARATRLCMTLLCPWWCAWGRAKGGELGDGARRMGVDLRGYPWPGLDGSATSAGDLVAASTQGTLALGVSP